ncbi:MAG: sugar-binding transcriptional regulator [Stappiaceae bacterium]
MAGKSENETSRLDDAARAGWLYYVAGNTQDEIAKKLGVSRQSAQRLVSLAVSERLIKVRLDHPIAHCMELSVKLRKKFDLEKCEVVPSDPTSQSSTVGIAEAASEEMERYLKSSKPLIIAMGTGRTLRAAVEQLPPMDCPQHRIVSLVGNIASDGSASMYDVIIRIADTVKAPHFPMPLPVIASTAQERALLQDQKPMRNILDLAAQADVTFVGIGSMDDQAPLLDDQFITRDELRALRRAGAVGEIVGFVFDGNGDLIEGLTNDRVAGAELTRDPEKPVFGIAAGAHKVPAIKAALNGKLINALITNEITAEQLLE